MASILLLKVFLPLIIRVLLGDFEVGLPGKPTLSDRRGIGSVLTCSVRTGMTSGSF